MAQEDLILINPIIVGVAAGDHCCQSLQFQLSPLEWHFGMKVSSSQMEWCFQGWRYEDIYQTVAGSFVGDDKFTNKKKTPQIIKTNGVMNMPTRKQVDTSTSSKLHWSREAGVGGTTSSCWIRHKICHICQSERQIGRKKNRGKRFHN